MRYPAVKFGNSEFELDGDVAWFGCAPAVLFFNFFEFNKCFFEFFLEGLVEFCDSNELVFVVEYRVFF